MKCNESWHNLTKGSFETQEKCNESWYTLTKGSFETQTMEIVFRLIYSGLHQSDN